MPQLNFNGNVAYVFVCPVCLDRHIGAEPTKDVLTDNWMTLHSRWHTDHPEDKGKPRQIVKLDGSIRDIVEGML